MEALSILRCCSLPSSRNSLGCLWSGDEVPEGCFAQPLPNTKTLSNICSIVTVSTTEVQLVSPDSCASRVLPGFSGQSDASSDSGHPQAQKITLSFGAWKKVPLKFIQVRKCPWIESYLASIKSCTLLFQL